jgi:hypothetical protein
VLYQRPLAFIQETIGSRTGRIRNCTGKPENVRNLAD